MSATAVAIRPRAVTLDSLKLTSDRKVSQYSVWEAGAKRFKPVVQNTVGTTAGASCPGATEWCFGTAERKGPCYAAKLEQAFPSVGRLVDHNLAVLRGTDESGMVALYRAAIATYRATLAKGVKRSGRDLPNVFRFKWDGDLFSAEEAGAIATVIGENPDVSFWLYTRSFGFVGAFAGLSNVSLYLSVDPSNIAEAVTTGQMFPWVHYAFCADTWDETETLSRTVTGRNSPRCPELTGKVPMVLPDGTGACVACGLCIKGVNNVRFAKH